MFFQSGGCCDGSLPICFDLGEFVLSDHDILLGDVGGCPFYIDHRQFEAWKHTQLILDVSSGLPEGFSLPAGTDEHFVTDSRLYRHEQTSGVGSRYAPRCVRTIDAGAHVSRRLGGLEVTSVPEPIRP